MFFSSSRGITGRRCSGLSATPLPFGRRPVRQSFPPLVRLNDIKSHVTSDSSVQAGFCGIFRVLSVGSVSYQYLNVPQTAGHMADAERLVEWRDSVLLSHEKHQNK